MPNGLVYNPSDGLIYVPNSARSDLKVMRFHPLNGSITHIQQIELGMPVDNLATDANGDVWAAGIPKAATIVRSLKDPSVESPVTIFQIRTGERGEYEVQKVIEDRAGAMLSGVTTVVHDVQTGKLFMGGRPEFLISG